MKRTPPLNPSPEATSEWLTTIEVAAVLRVHPKHVYRLLHQGMPARRVGGQWRFSRDAILQWAERRGESLGSDTTAAEPASASSLASLVAIEPNEISDGVVAAFGNIAQGRVAVVHADSRRSLALLASGEVSAAVVRRDDAAEAACATVRITLGARQLGVVTRASSATQPAIIAVPPLSQLPPLHIAAWLEAARQRGAQLHRVAADLDACSSVLRGEADAAIGSHSWAQRLGLSFCALEAEPWELAVRVDAMEDPAVSCMCGAAQGDALRERLAGMLLDSFVVGQMRLERGIAPGPAQQVAPGDAAAADETNDKSRGTVRWTVLTRDRADQMMDLVGALRDRGLRLGGFIQVPSGPASSKPLGYDLYRLSQTERLPLAERMVHAQRRVAGERSCELTFHASALLRACEWLREDVAVSDVLIVDGVGRLEERGQGIFPALAWARMQARPKLIVLSSRRDHVPGVAQRLSLADTAYTQLAFGDEESAPAHVIDHIMHACGRIRRSRARGPRPE